MNRIKRTIVYLFALICVLVSIGGAFDAHKRWDQYSDWQQTTCRIEKLEFERGGRRFGGRYSLNLRFSYSFDGETFTGDRYENEFGADNFSKFEKNLIEEEYQEGSEANAYVNPEWPQQSFLKREGLVELMAVPVALFFLGLWVFYLLRKTRPRTVPRRVYAEADDPDSRRWHAIYQEVIDLELVKVEGSAWYAQSPGISQWPKSRVGLIATPNMVAVVRGPFRISGIAAAGLTIFAELFLAWYLAVIHFFFFAYEWWRRKRTWRAFRQATTISELKAGVHSVEIVSIDNSLMHGVDERTKEFWYRLPSRPVDDAIKVPRSQRDQVDRYIGFVRLMQQSRKILDEESQTTSQENPEITFLD